MNINIIVAIDADGGIGLDGKIPWIDLKTDIITWDKAHFRSMTRGAAVIMGRHTYQSIGEPLSKRLNIVISNTMTPDDNPYIHICKTLDDALELVGPFRQIFIIGGEALYREAINRNLCRAIYVTHIPGSWGCDRHFPINQVIAQYASTAFGQYCTVYQPRIL